MDDHGDEEIPIKDKIAEYILNCNNEDDHFVEMSLDKVNEMDEQDVIIASVGLVYIFLYKNTVVFKPDGDEMLANYSRMWNRRRENYTEQFFLPPEYLSKLSPTDLDKAQEIFKVAYKWHEKITKWMLDGDKSHLSVIDYADRFVIAQRFVDLFVKTMEISYQKLVFVSHLNCNNITVDSASLKSKVSSNPFPLYLPIGTKIIPTAMDVGKLFESILEDV